MEISHWPAAGGNFWALVASRSDFPLKNKSRNFADAYLKFLGMRHFAQPTYLKNVRYIPVPKKPHWWSGFWASTLGHPMWFRKATGPASCICLKFYITLITTLVPVDPWRTNFNIIIDCGLFPERQIHSGKRKAWPCDRNIFRISLNKFRCRFDPVISDTSGLWSNANN